MSAFTAWAQQPDETLPGFSSKNLLEGHSVDNVNLFSGDPGLVIPLGPDYTLSAGAKWQLSAYYSSKFWHFDDKDCTTQNPMQHALLRGSPTLGVGWTLDPGYYLPSSLSESGYHAPDGGVPTRHLAMSHLRVRMNPTGLCTAPCYAVDFPDGTTQVFATAFNRPRPTLTNCPACTYPNQDFTDDDWTIDPSASTRYGLTKIIDQFGSTVLTVQYGVLDGQSHYHPDEINTITIHQAQDQVIQYHWGDVIDPDYANGTPDWRVVTSIDFPTAGGTLSTVFTMLTGTIARNNFDSSIGSGSLCPSSSSQTSFRVGVHYVSQIDFKQGGTTLATYSFPGYQLGIQNFEPLLTQATLPTGGSINYTYSKTTHSCLSLLTNPTACTDVETGVWMPQDGEGPDVPGGHVAYYVQFLELTPGISQRQEKDAGNNVLSTTGYLRYQWIPMSTLTPAVAYDTKIGRQAVVTRASGNGGNFVTKYIFHAAYSDDTQAELDDGGIEIERRYYAENDTGTGTPIRSLINCWEGDPSGASCGYRSTSGTPAPPASYSLSGDVRRQASLTWYGVNPTGGGACSQATTGCIQSVNSFYNNTALKYATTTTSNLHLTSGGATRTSTTTWTPWADSSHWLLNLYSEKDETEGSVTVKQFAEFDSPSNGQQNGAYPGFFRGSWSYEPTNDTNHPTGLRVTCRIPTTGGVVDKDFSATYSHADVPPSLFNICSGYYLNYPTNGAIGTNGDAFGHSYFWSNGLLTQSQWLVEPVTGGSPASIGWSDFNVARDAATGNIVTSIATDALSTGYGYDVLGRIISITPPGGDAKTFVCYDSTTQTTVYRSMSARSCPQVPGTALTWERDLYDNLGRLTRTIRQMPTNYSFQNHAYDSADHDFKDSEWTTCTSYVGDCTTASAVGTTLSNYDPFDRAQTIQRADLSTTNVSYTDGSITASDMLEAVTVNNVGGTNPVTTTRKDSYGRVVSVTEPLVGTADVTTYTYNVLNNLATVSQGSQNRTYTYDRLGFLRNEVNPEKGVAGNGTTSYTGYGSLGNILTKSDGDTGNSTYAHAYSYTYDAAGRLWTEAADGTASSNYYLANCYDGATGGTGCPTPPTGLSWSRGSGGTYPLGRLTRQYSYNPVVSTNDWTADDFLFSDPAGRLSQRTSGLRGDLITSNPTLAGVFPLTSLWTYNNLGLIWTYQHPYSSKAPTLYQVVSTLTYNAGLPATLSAAVGGVNQQYPYLVSAATYNPAGGLASWTAFNGVKTTISPDTIPTRPNSIATSGAQTGPGCTVQPCNFSTGTYTYDGAGNITAMGPDTFGYDARSRLMSTSIGGQSYSYDRYGNLNPTLVNPNNNRLLPGDTNYDALGNLKTQTGITIAYDPLSRQTSYTNSLGTQIFGYEGSSERLYAVVGGGVQWVVTPRDEANRLSSKYNVTATAVGRNRDHFYFGNLLAAIYDGTNWTYYASDHLGTPRLVTNSAGGVTETHKYYPYGAEIPGSFGVSALKFAMMERDSLNNNDYDHARFHLTGMGRFLGVDKLGGHLRDPQSWNRYTYTRSNPLRFNDPNGLETNPVTGGSGIADSNIRTTATNPDIGRFGDGDTRVDKYGDPLPHGGVDLVAEVGTPLHAPIGGIAKVFTTKLGGLIVAIVTSRDGQSVRESIAHLSSASVKTGDQVNEGQIVARSGVSGNAKKLTGNQQHTHLAVRVNDALVDPQPYFAAHPSQATPLPQSGCGSVGFVGPCQAMQSTSEGGPPTL